jgi:beta-aspartyl-peptidase (threonine type)
MPPLRALAALLCLLTFAAGCSGPGRREAATTAELIQLLQTQQAAWNAGDVERFVELGYWRSPELTFFSGGTVTKGYQPLIERYRERYVESGEGMGTLTFSELEPFPLGSDAAMVRGRWRLHREGATPVGGLFTLILRRFDGGWRIVHDHTSVDEPAE